MILVLLCCLLWSLGPWDKKYGLENRTWPTQPSGKKVEVIKSPQGFQLYRNGQPYYIKGASGSKHFSELKRAGGNAFRTYTTDSLKSILDSCHAQGLSVLASFHLGKIDYYFNYRDSVAVKKQKDRVRKVVLENKDHPALLAWGLGNEVFFELPEEELVVVLSALEDLAQMIKELDPDHPVTTAFTAKTALDPRIMKYFPSLDFFTINAFEMLRKPLLMDHTRLSNYSAPFLLSEWEVRGVWESPKTEWGDPIEPGVFEKTKSLKTTYQEFITQHADYCMGSFVFFWGQKQEGTASWFSMFSEQGEKTPMVDLMTDLWGGGPVENRAPFLDSFLLNIPHSVEASFIDIRQKVTVKVKAQDPEGDSLTYRWKIIEGDIKYDPDRGGIELLPEIIEGSEQVTSVSQLTFQVPSKVGPYRLVVDVYDGYGNFCSANWPFFATDNRLTEK